MRDSTRHALSFPREQARMVSPVILTTISPCVRPEWNGRKKEAGIEETGKWALRYRDAVLPSADSSFVALRQDAPSGYRS
jgi:hypothetical protein